MMEDPGELMVDDIKVQHKMATSFGRLPDDIILLILRLCDPNCFASLVLLNRNWRRVSQQAHLYAHQLSKCRSYAAARHTIDTPTTDDQLPSLRMLFAREVKRNLFEAFLRPRETVIKLVSTSISSSSAFPGGEAFYFSFSPNGQFVLAYSTSRIYVVHAGEGDLAVKRELKILRRPASVTILDDGSLLAVLSTDHQVDLYDLSKDQAVHIRAVALDHPPRTIALDAAGSVLAAAYDGGIEVYSLSSTALPTDQRGVKCDTADSLSFSSDGTQLLGTTSHSKNPSTVILTAPYFNPAEHAPEDSISQLWTTSILFPNSSRDCSHAVLLPCPMNDTSWTFTYDRVFETFRAVRIDDLRNGTTYFTGPLSKEAAVTKLLPSTLPAATGAGDMVAAGFQGKEIWIYGVPEDLEAVPETSYSVHQTWDGETGTPKTLSRANSGPSPRSHTWPRDSNTSRMPQWKLLCDKSRNTFVEGHQIGSLDGISSLKWVSAKTLSGFGERLIAVAPGGVSQPNGMLFNGDNDGASPVDGGRLFILDFFYGISNGEKTELTIEVGENEPETLEEEHRDLEAEVAIVRRRTVAQRKGGRTPVNRANTVATRLNPGVSQGSSSTAGTRSVPLISTNPRNLISPTAIQSDTASIDEDQESLDAPYSHGNPRSRVTLNRAATAAAASRRLHPRIIAGQEHLTFRRADGREEHPHESDADNWVPPPPPYTKEAVPPLPEHLKNAIVAGFGPSSANLHRAATQRSNGSAESDILSTLHRSRTTFVRSGSGRSAHADTQQRLSVATNISSNDAPTSAIRAPVENAATQSFEDIYDVSPPNSPGPAEPAEPVAVTPPTPVAVPLHQIPRRPVAFSGVTEDSPLIIRDASSVEPESPRPQHLVQNSIGRPVSEISVEWDSAQDQGRVSPMETTSIPTSSEPLMVASDIVNSSAIPGSNDNHPVAFPPTTSWVDGARGRVGQRADPPDLNVATIQPVASTFDQISNDLDMPSAAQLARLNSRSGRPGNRVIVDPSRRRSGSFTPPQSPARVQAQFRNGQYAPPNIFVPDHRAFAAPRAASGSHGMPMLSPIIDSPVHTRSSLSESVGRPSNPGNSRPRVVRLETINSVASQGETAITSSAPSIQQMRPALLSRQPSRAERSAAMNMQQAKKNGWRGTAKNSKNRDRDGASSAGWTDVSRESVPKERKESKGNKCVIL